RRPATFSAKNRKRTCPISRYTVHPTGREPTVADQEPPHMMKEVVLAITLTLFFSVGVGVLFVRTIMEMLEILFTEPPAQREHHGQAGKGS
ncbi:MAG TPA: hypothetical protein VIV61_14005, partial [Candidatus Ozemobacteraceae bacterium]